MNQIELSNVEAVALLSQDPFDIDSSGEGRARNASSKKVPWLTYGFRLVGFLLLVATVAVFGGNLVDWARGSQVTARGTGSERARVSAGLGREDQRLFGDAEADEPPPALSGDAASWPEAVQARRITAKPRGDTRRYQFAQLSNGMQVVNVQDDRATKNAYAVAVHAGSFNDPKELPGLAHFCEHMLFLGTERFPEASSFDNFMSANGGSNNAYTANEMTVYFAEVTQAAGPETSDRLADFFRAPLFQHKFVEKEVHAIDSEHAKNVQDPMWRELAVMNSQANPESPMSRFHTGDKKTLYEDPKANGIDPVAALKHYFAGHYCPSKMHLVTFGSGSLEGQLEAAAKDFGKLEKGATACHSPWHNFSSPRPFPPRMLGKWQTIKGTQPMAHLWLLFPMPDLSQFYHHQPADYMEYILQYGGVDSLSRVLQDNLGLVSSFQTMFDSQSSGTSLYIKADLTPRGRQVESLGLLLDVVYSYLARVRRNGIDQALYSSLRDIAKLKWDWAEPPGPMNTVSGLAARMVRYPAADILSSEALIETVNVTLVASLLAMLTPENMNVAFVTPSGRDHESDDQGGQDECFPTGAEVHRLPHYGVNYTVQELDDVFPGAADRWRSWLMAKVGASSISADIDAKLHKVQAEAVGTPIPMPPKPIEGVPSDISLDNMHADVAGAEKGRTGAGIFGPHPRKVNSNGGHRALRILEDKAVTESHVLEDTAPEIWYRSGWVTTSPKVQIQLALRPLRTPGEQEISALDSMRLVLYSRLFGEEIIPHLVDLTATGVTYGLDVTGAGLSFVFTGFAPLMQRLVDSVVGEFNSFNRDPSHSKRGRFTRNMQVLKDDLTTFSEMPIQYAIGDRNLLVTRGAHSRAEKLAALEKVSQVSALSAAVDLLLKRPMRLTALSMGNLGASDAARVVDSVAGHLELPPGASQADVGAEGRVERVKPIVDVREPVELRKLNPRKGDPNDAVVVSLMQGVSTIESRVKLALLGRILAPVAYNELRTRRQLGYVVSAGMGMVSNALYISCVVQGTALGADEMESAVQAVFTHFMPKKLEALTEEEFATYKEAYRQDLQKPPLAFTEEVSHFWTPVAQGGHCLDLRTEMLKYLNTPAVSKDTLKDAWADLALPKSGVRGKVVVKYFAGKVPPRPALAVAAASWKEQGVPEGEASALLERELAKTLVLDSADAPARQRLVKRNDDAGRPGYLPPDLHCHVSSAPPSTSSTRLRANLRA